MDSPQNMLRRSGLRPKRSWGQNFLADHSSLARIVEALSLTPIDTVVELGSGLGHLTSALAATGASVVAVERDRQMVHILEGLTLPNVRVLSANAAKIQFAESAGTSTVVIAGNLPFHLTSPILFQILRQRQSISRAVLTLQSEVAQRLCASPGGRDYGLLSVLLGLYFDVQTLFQLGPELFYPSPKVQSTAVRLLPLLKPRAQVSSEENFQRVVKACFAQRRKTLFNSLKSALAGPTAEFLHAKLDEVGISPRRRAETLSVEEFAALERAMAKSLR